MGVTWFGNSPESDLQWVKDLEAGRQRAAAAAAHWNASTSFYAARIADMSPWMDPGIVLALAKGNASPSAIMQASKLTAARRAQLPNSPVGSRSRVSQLNVGDRRTFETGRNPVDWESEYMRDRSRAREHFVNVTRPGLVSEFERDEATRRRGTGLNPIERAWSQARAAGLVDENGFLIQPTATDVDQNPQNFIFKSIVRDLLNAGVTNIPVASAWEGGRVGFLTPVSSQTLREAERGGTVVNMGVQGALWRPIPLPEMPEPSGPFARVGKAIEYAAESFGNRPQVMGGQQTLQLPDVGAPVREFQQRTGLDAFTRDVNRGVAQELESRHLPTLGDVPGFRGTAIGESTQQAGVGVSGTNIQESIQFSGALANAPIQEFTGQIRNAYGAATGRDVDWWESQSDFGIMAATDMEPGDGFFVDPDSEVATERLRREEERGQIYGQNITLGRIVAGGLARIGVIEPGETAYRVLSGVVDLVPQVLDPTAVGLGAVGKGLGARAVFMLGREAGEELIEHPTVATSTLRSLASSFEVRGRSSMGRDDLLRALAGHEAELGNLSTQRLRGLAATFNVSGRSSMNRQGLVDAVTEGWRNLGATTPAAGVAPQAIRATSIPSAVARGLAQGTRITGIPQAAERLGLIKGNFLNGVHGPTWDGALQGKFISRKVDLLANATDAYKIDVATGHKLLAHEILALQEASTPAEVSDILRGAVNRGGIRTTGEVLPRPSALADDWSTAMWADPINGLPTWSYAEARALQDVPGTFIDTDDPRSLMDESVAWMRNANMDEADISTHFDALIRATNFNEKFAAVEDIMANTRGVLERAGVRSPEVRNTITKAFRKEHYEMRDHFLSEVTDQQSLLDEVVVGGSSYNTGNPHDWAAVANRFIYLPDYREVRRLTSKVPDAFASAAWDEYGKLRAIPHAMMTLQEDIWKPMTLLRGAWTVRVVGEEQVRMGAAGLAGMFSDPLSYVAFAIARRNDAVGDPYAMAREFQASQMGRTNGWISERPGRVRTGRPRPYARYDKGYSEAWGAQLLEMHADPVLQRLASGNSIAEVEDWLLNGGGRDIYEGYLRNHSERFGQPGYSLRNYLEQAARWNELFTGGNDDLLRVIREGKVGSGRQVRDAFTSDGINPSEGLVKALRNRYADQGPEELLGPAELNQRQRGRVVDRAFSWLGAKPTNYLSRSQTFRQSYWPRIAEMISGASPKAKEEILANATAKGRFGITEAPREIIDAIRRTEAKGHLSADMIDTAAKGYALDKTKQLLYDLSRRSQIADSMRLVAPFGEAWREVITRWAGLRTGLVSPFRPEGLKNIRRFQQVIQGMRGEDLGEVLQAPEVYNPDTGVWEQQGFFWRDQYGEEIFVFPGSQWINQFATWVASGGERSVPTPLTGRVAGLSMVGEILPGIGPVAAIPTNWFLSDAPGDIGNIEILGRELREWALPYGHPAEAQGSTAISQVLNYAPPYLRSAVMAAVGGGWEQDTNRLFANSVMSTANYLYSTGRYDTSSQAGRSKLLEDAKDSARVLYGFRFLAAFGAPAAPSMEFLTRTNEGLVLTSMLRDEYYRLVDENGYEDADTLFLDRFGDQAAMVMQAHTREIAGGVEPTEEFDDWARSEGGQLRRDFPAVWGFFGPSGGEFDYDSYAHQIRSGQREALTPQEWLNLGQNHLGQMIHDVMMESLGPSENWTDEMRAAKAEFEAEIYEIYPGFEDFTGLEGRASREQVMRELGDAVLDERVLATEAGQALQIYWEARSRAMDIAIGDGFKGIDRAKSLAPIRERLFSLGTDLSAEYPDFARLWLRQLAHEVKPHPGED